MAPAQMMKQLQFAHGRLFASFPPYKLAVFAGPAALVCAMAGFTLLRPPPLVVAKPYNAPAPANSTAPNSSAPATAPAPVALTGDYATCSNADFGFAQAAAQAVIDACTRIIGGTAQGTGSLDQKTALLDRSVGEHDVNNTQAAQADAATVIAQDPGNARAFYLRAVYDFQLGQQAGAMSDANQAISLAPNYWLAYDARANAEIANGDYAGALADSNVSIQNQPSYAYAYYNKSVAEGHTGDYAQAVSDANTFIATITNPQTDPNEPWALLARGYAEGHIPGQEQAAINDLNASVHQDPTSAAYDELSAIALRKGDYQVAKDDASAALKVNPSDVLGLNARAGAEIRLMQYQAAKADEVLALELYPPANLLASVYENLGLAEYDLNDFKDAVTSLEKAVPYDPNNQGLISTIATAKQQQ